MSVREIYAKFDELKNYIELAEQELGEKAREWNIEGSSMLDIISKFPF